MLSLVENNFAKFDPILLTPF